MKRLLIFICLATVIFAMTSCSSKGGKGLFTPTSSGRPYEVLVVVNPGVWDRPSGRALHDVLSANVPGLPQPESSFRISHVAPKDMDATLKLFRNIVVVDIQDIYSKAKLKAGNDVYATPQTIMTIQAPTEDALKTCVTKNKQVILDYFTKNEMNRRIATLREDYSKIISEDIQAKFGCNINMPLELQGKAAKKGKDFYWASTNRAVADLNFVMYTYPYRSKKTFTLDFFKHKRDSVMKINVPGARKGMYMQTDSIFVDMRNLKVNGRYIQEVKGLWYVKGDMMGGPFVSHAMVDEANQRVVVVEAFVYAPSKLKRNYIRQMEAALYTLTIPKIATIDEIPITGVAVDKKKK